MPVGIDGQYIFRFTLDNNYDFIVSGNLDYFNFVEETGGSLPTWEISFYTEDKNLLKKFNEGNKFIVSYGVKLDDPLQDMELYISKITPPKHGESKFYINAFGTLNNIPYLINTKTNVSDKKSGIEIMSETGKECFRKIDTNIAKSEDSQYWVRDHISVKKFLTQLWLHSYLSKSFIGYGINIKNELVIRDFAKLANTTSKFIFSNSRSDNVALSYLPDYIIDNSNGFINCYSGYGLERPIHTIEDDSHDVTSEEYKKLIANVSKINRKAEVERRSLALGIHNDNCHEKYWQAADRNIQGLSIMSSVVNTFTFGNVFNKIQIFDLIDFYDDSLDSTTTESIKDYSGKWIVGKVGRSVSASNFITTIEAYRESFNEITGNLR